MTNRQSNFIFYSVVFLTISGFLINLLFPSAFDGFKMSKDQLVIKEAMANRAYPKALNSYQNLIAKQISDGHEITLQTTIMYEEMAHLYTLMNNNKLAKQYYLKSLAVKKQLNNADSYTLANVYYQLGLIAEQEQQTDRAISYYEQSLSARLRDIKTPVEGDEGMFENMQESRLGYLKSNHEDTIANYKKLGTLHNAKLEHAIANRYFAKALSASVNTFGEDDPRTLQIRGLIKGL